MGDTQTLWVFGDSHTAGHGCTPTFEYYKKYRKVGDDIWPNHLSEWLGVSLQNKGSNGNSNDSILDSVIDSFEEIKEGDIVIIGKTYSHRLDIPQKDGFGPIFWDLDKLILDDILSQFTLEERMCIMDFQYYFMKSPLFNERWDKRFHWIKKVLEKIGCKVILWDVTIDLKRLKTIKIDTNNKIDDTHMAFKGHRDFANNMFMHHFKEKTLI